MLRPSPVKSRTAESPTPTPAAKAQQSLILLFLPPPLLLQKLPSTRHPLWAEVHPAQHQTVSLQPITLHAPASCLLCPLMASPAAADVWLHPSHFTGGKPEARPAEGSAPAAAGLRMESPGIHILRPGLRHCLLFGALTPPCVSGGRGGRLSLPAGLLPTVSLHPPLTQWLPLTSVGVESWNRGKGWAGGRCCRK